MKSKFKILAPIIIIISLSLIGCKSNSITTPTKNVKTTSQINTDDLLKYKGSYVGDNSAIGHIISELPAREYNAGFNLETTKEPYGITINYKANQSLGIENYNDFWKNKNLDEFLEKNAVILLALIQNSDYIQFNIDDVGKESYNYTRNDLEQKYGVDLKDLL